MKLQLVTGGLECLLHVIEGGNPPVFSSIKYGNGADAGIDASEMSNVMKSIEITSITRETGSDFVKLTGKFSNYEIEQRFKATETGVFIKDPDDNTKELLFAYAHVDEDEAILIPAVTDYLFETIDSVMVYVGKVENVSAIIVQSMITATKQELEAHTEDKNNPHNTTASQVGAAATNHTHSANDINNGVLPELRGGTGVTSLTALASKLTATDSGLCRISAGSYVGDGRAGQGCPTSLTFDAPPKLLIVMQSNNVSGCSAGGFIAIRGLERSIMGGIMDDAGSATLHYTWNGNTVSWYCNTTSSTFQQNIENKTYLYFAIL